jgi:Cu2+-containing amine oxidase
MNQLVTAVKDVGSVPCSRLTGVHDHAADGFFWYFYQDGGIQHEVKLTGILSTNGLSQGEGPLPDYGVLMAPGLNAQIHQHFFNVRMDMAVDDDSGGANLTAVEVRIAQLDTLRWA